MSPPQVTLLTLSLIVRARHRAEDLDDENIGDPVDTGDLEGNVDDLLDIGTLQDALVEWLRDFRGIECEVLNTALTSQEIDDPNPEDADV